LRSLALPIVAISPRTTSPLDISKRLVGVVTGGPESTLVRGPASSQYVAAVHKAFPERDAAPKRFFLLAYYGSKHAAPRALEQLYGDLSGGERRFRAALAKLRLDRRRDRPDRA